ncbi:MAG TPA: lactate utilization protein C [Azospira sp.]|nr:lactate utilization protein C [Azospira sp.]
MSARNDILNRVRHQLGEGEAAARRARVQATLAARIGQAQGPRPSPREDLLAEFQRRAQALASTVDVVSGWDQAPAALARYLAGHNLPAKGVAWPALPPLDWAGAGLEMRIGAATGDDRLGVTGCFCAIAETGTLMLVGDGDRHGVTSLLPETHVALVPASSLVWGTEEGWARLRAGRELLPRTVNFVSGPSRTGDIEQTLVLGAHGPYRVHLILLQDQ